LRGNPTFWNTASARSARVNVFPLIVRVLPQGRGINQDANRASAARSIAAAIKFLILHHFR
jgi:hypothetical protein